MRDKKKKTISTFEHFMQDKSQKEKFDKEYGNFLLKEFLFEAMNENHISVRKLSEESGISTSIIQNIKSEKTSNVTFNTLNSLMTALGYRIIIKKVQNEKERPKEKVKKLIERSALA